MKKTTINSALTLAFVVCLGVFSTACSSKKDQVKADETLAEGQNSTSGQTVAQADSSNLGASSSGRGR